MQFSAIESSVLRTASPEAVDLTKAEADDLLANVAYHGSFGDPVSATHYRRSLASGGCLHLIFNSSKATLHFDKYDPHAGPHMLVAHLSQESPRQALSLAVAALAVLRRARS